jgi:hypothetical protein
MSLVRVWTNVGQRKPKALVAKIFDRAPGPVYTIRYLSAVSEEDERGRQIFRYEEETYEVDDDSIAEWIGTDVEEDAGYTEVDDGAWIREDSDSDYVPSESDTTESSSSDYDDEDPEEEAEEAESEENSDYE